MRNKYVTTSLVAFRRDDRRNILFSIDSVCAPQTDYQQTWSQSLNFSLANRIFLLANSSISYLDPDTLQGFTHQRRKQCFAARLASVWNRLSFDIVAVNTERESLGPSVFHPSPEQSKITTMSDKQASWLMKSVFALLAYDR